MHRTISDPRFRFSRRRLLQTSLVTGALAATPTIAGWPRRVSATQATPTAGDSLASMPTPRGTILAVSPLGRLDIDEVTAQIAAIGLDTSRVRGGVRPYQVVYQTVDPVGNPTTASGLAVFPDSDAAVSRHVAWLHGTTVFRGEAASLAADGGDRLIAFAFAAAGYAVTAPDYLGLGLGPGTHPYDHLPSTVTASLDALRATRTLAADVGSTVDERVLVTGFSQGGPATMALGQALQDGADPGIGLAALAPISGPYDFSGTLRAALAGEINAAPQYLAYLVVAWNRLHGLYDSPGDAFVAPYEAVVESVIDNNHTPDEVFAALPMSDPRELFTPSFLDAMLHPTGAFQEALRVADGSTDWRPDVPVTLYAATGDRDVPIANATHAQDVLKAQGVAAEVVDVGDVDHGTSVVLSVPLVLEWFDGLGGEG